MMKKLLLLVCALFAFNSAVQSQTVSTPTYVMTDVLHYYFNKQYFKTGPKHLAVDSVLTSFPYYKAAAATVTNVSHMGSKFECPSTMTITGLEGYAARNLKSGQLSIKVHLYLCTLDVVTGMPVIPAIDSIVSIVGGTVTTLIGGDFLVPHVMSSNFAVLIRNMSTLSGDTVRVLRTAGLTPTNTSAPTVKKISDGNGVIRNNGKFFSVTNYTAAGFGVGTDYEFCVAPRVKYDIWAAHTIPNNVNPVCAWEPMVFTNNSAPQWTHRMYNLIEFYRKWNLYSAFAAAPKDGWAADSSITWFFEPEDNGGRKPDPRAFLPYGGSKIAYITDSAMYSLVDGESDSLLCFNSCALRAHFRSMGSMGVGPQIDTIMEFPICTHYCTSTVRGLVSYDQLKNVQVYPNPANNGRTYISGLKGRNSIHIYNMTGQLLSAEVTEKETAVVDLQKYSEGNYMVRITDSANRSKVVKVIR